MEPLCTVIGAVVTIGAEAEVVWGPLPLLEPPLIVTCARRRWRLGRGARADWVPGAPCACKPDGGGGSAGLRG